MAVVNNVRDFIFDKLNWRAYWAGHQDYAEAKDLTILNLWRITDEGKEIHSQQVYEFLKRGPFKEEFYKLKYCSTVVYMVPRA